jgi:hypothetical protein
VPWQSLALARLARNYRNDLFSDKPDTFRGNLIDQMQLLFK